MSSDPEVTGPRRGGRPRSEASRDAILDAATAIVAEQGYAAASIEQIARRAGVGKQTIYRWWPSRGDVLMDALVRKVDVQIPLADEGSWTGDLRRLLDDSLAMAGVPQLLDLLRALMVEAELDPAFGDRFRAGFLQSRRDAMATLVQRARRRGDLPAGITADLASDVVFGVFWYRMLVLPRPFDRRLVNQVVGLLTA